MSTLLGVEPILIDSNLFSAQDRRRFYWTNIPLDPLPENPSREVLEDVLDDNVDESYFYPQTFDFYGEDKKVCATLHINGHDILKRVNSKRFKCQTLTACRGGNHQKKVYDNGRCRKLTEHEYRRLQTIPDWYQMNVAKGHIYNMCGDGWTIDTIKFIFKNLNTTK
jgi:DNA (cytosine-5)-methyltransferase 3A